MLNAISTLATTSVEKSYGTALEGNDAQPSISPVTLYDPVCVAVCVDAFAPGISSPSTYHWYVEPGTGLADNTAPLMDATGAGAGTNVTLTTFDWTAVAGAQEALLVTVQVITASAVKGAVVYVADVPEALPLTYH